MATKSSQRFQAISAGPHHEFNDAISLVVLCDDQAELDRYWNALLAGGGAGMRLAHRPVRAQVADRPRDPGRHDA